MISFYKLDYAKDANGAALGKNVSHVDPMEDIRFIDVLREQGFEKALPLFPKRWEWIEEDGENLPILDLIPVFGSGIVLTEKAFRILRERFPLALAKHAAFNLVGATYYWASILIMYGDVKTVDETLLTATDPMICLLPGAVKICSQDFRKVWLESGLTGGVFTATGR